MFFLFLFPFFFFSFWLSFFLYFLSGRKIAFAFFWLEFCFYCFWIIFGIIFQLNDFQDFQDKPAIYIITTAFESNGVGFGALMHRTVAEP